MCDQARIRRILTMPLPTGGEAVNLVITSQPSAPVVDLATAKNFLRVNTNQDDLLIPILVAAAVEAVEAYTGRSVATRIYTQCLDCFPLLR